MFNSQLGRVGSHADHEEDPAFSPAILLVAESGCGNPASFIFSPKELFDLALSDSEHLFIGFAR